jgi:murein L,D-transpeptidase YcbB/YkuD
MTQSTPENHVSPAYGLVTLLRRLVLAAFLVAAILFAGVVQKRTASSQVPLPSDTILVKDHTRGIVTERIMEEAAAGRETGQMKLDPSELDDLILSIRESVFDGLNPADYDVARLEALAARRLSASSADVKLEQETVDAMTRSYLKLAFDLRFGRGDIGGYDESWHFARNAEPDSMVAELKRSLAHGSVRESLFAMRPQDPVYAALREHLALYLRVRDAGGWPVIPPGPPIVPDTRDPRIPLIRETLSAMRDLPLPASRTSPAYDGILAASVARFQERHGLPVSDTVTAATMKAMSIPVEKRIETLRANLERARWFLRQSPDTALVVNIPTFDARLVAGDSVRWSGRVQVGMLDRKTPVLHSTVQYVEFNPRWTVPKTILEKDIFPRMQRGSNIVKKKNLVMYDFRGNAVDPLAVDWSRFSTAKRFPYLLRQDPGAGNALGRIKFVFPNEHGIYLHDTPSKYLFAKQDRAFSSGCVRVERPFDLAVALLDDPAWTGEDVRKAAQAGVTKRVPLHSPVPITLTYWTATVDEAGRLIWYGDVYGNDQLVLSALRNAEEPDGLLIAMQRKGGAPADTSDVEF